MLNKCSDEISHHFKDNNIAKAKEAIIRMKYYTTIMRRINDLMREKGIVD